MPRPIGAPRGPCGFGRGRPRVRWRRSSCRLAEASGSTIESEALGRVEPKSHRPGPLGGGKDRGHHQPGTLDPLPEEFDLAEEGLDRCPGAVLLARSASHSTDGHGDGHDHFMADDL